MTSFLLVVSLLLNGVTIFSIIILYARQNRFLEIEKTHDQMVKDMEEVISSYLFEMKEENEAFIKQFQKISSNSPSKEIHSKTKQQTAQKTPAAANDLIIGTEEPAEIDLNGKIRNAYKKQAVKAYKSAAANKEENTDNYLPNEALPHAPEVTEQTEDTNGKTQLTHEEIYRDLFVNQVKLLQKQGLTSDEIAKKLNRGKTEIELLLKFS